MIKTTIPFTFSHLKTPQKRYYMTRFVIIVKRCVIRLSLGSVRITPIPEVTKVHFRSSLKYYKWTCRHPTPKQYKNHQILLNIGVVRSVPGLHRCKRTRQIWRLYFHILRKPTRICNKINFHKQIRRETFFCDKSDHAIITSSSLRLGFATPTQNFNRYYVRPQIWPIHAHGPSEQKPIRNFGKSSRRVRVLSKIFREPIYRANHI